MSQDFSKDYLKIKYKEIVAEYVKDKKGNNLDILNNLLLKGKNIRPLIFLNVVALKNKLRNIKNELVVAIELLHCASLVIDDLPCMDNDSIRRGEPTTHIKYGVSKAQLIANRLIIDALNIIFKTCDNTCKNIVINQLKNATLGQYYDIYNFEINNCDFIINEISFKINLKTAPFFNVAFILAAFCLKDESNMKNNSDYYKPFIDVGNCFSSMFQICDDIEDYEKDKAKNHNMNHCIILGHKRTVELYKKSKNEFLEGIKDLNLQCEYFSEIVDLLDNKVNSK